MNYRKENKMKIVVTKESIYLVGAEDSTPEEIENGYQDYGY